MSATSGIGLSPELTQTFSAALSSGDVRFLKISIRDEALVADRTIRAVSTLEKDLDQLQYALQDDIPAYVLARLDDGSGWLAISYVPDTARVRDKMLYAATRNALTRALGSANFPDTLFATSKDDLTATAYAAHRRHTAAPQPLSSREQELADARAAEGTAVYEGSGARINHIRSPVGLKWADDVEAAILALGQGEKSVLLLLSIDIATETLTLVSSKECTVDGISASLPTDAASYAFFAWQDGARRRIAFIYVCPSGSAIKTRMIYASAVVFTMHRARELVPALEKRKIEATDPHDINARLFEAEYPSAPEGSAADVETPVEEKKPFAKPKGPPRRR